MVVYESVGKRSVNNPVNACGYVRSTHFLYKEGISKQERCAARFRIRKRTSYYNNYYICLEVIILCIPSLMRYFGAQAFYFHSLSFSFLSTMTH